MRQVQSEIEIEAPPEKVWALLTDLDSYADWNPFITHAEGQIVEGARLKVFVKPPGARGRTFKPAVQKVEEGRGFSWLGNTLFPGLFDGHHYFALEPLTESRTRLVQGEYFTGIFAPVIVPLVGKGVLNGIKRMNEALRARAESSAPAI